LKSDVAPGLHELKLRKAKKKTKQNKKKQNKTNKIELRNDLIIYPQRYVGNLEFVPSTVTQKKKKNLFDKKINFEIFFDLIFYPQRERK
jgi:hypothetical protein